MQLEQLRENDIGTISASIPTLGADAITRLTYMQFVSVAFYSSARQVEELEMSTTQINQGTAVQTTVGMWFMSIEAYLNSILRISCLVTRHQFDDLKKRDLDGRIKSLFDILQLDKIPFYTGALQKLEEFKCYRNELFHDRTNEKQLSFKKTSFSGNPFLANQVDVMQAAVVALQVFNSFRYVIPKLDLMPQVVVTKSDSFFCEKLDVLYLQVLAPYFEKSISKHDLSSDIDLNISVPQLPESRIFSDVPVEINVKAVPEDKYHVAPSQQTTNIGAELLEAVRNNIAFDTNNSFKIFNFCR